MPDEKSSEPTNEPSAPKSGRKKTLVMGGVFLGLMVVEAVVVFTLVRQFGGGPATAHGETAPGIELKEGTKRPEEVEIEVVKLQAQNERSQRRLEYSLEVYVSVADADKDKLNDVLQRRKATIQDRLNGLIRASEPERFTEPDLRTLRKQIQTELAAIVGNPHLIKEVLIPSIVSDER